MIDVAGLVGGGIPATSVTLRTYGASTINAYGESDASSTDASATMVVHPSGRRELERLGLDSKRETISAYSTTAVGLSSTVRPPRILYGGRWYEVVRVGDYGALGGVYLLHAALIDEASS